jgi:hypothetical protein
MRRLIGISTVVWCIAALVAGAVGPAAAQTVTPSTFTTQVCAAVATADQAVKTSSAALKAAAQAYQSAPSPTTAAALRDAMTQTAQDLDQALATVLAAIQQSGTPTKGADFVAALVSSLETQRTLAQQLAQHSAAIDVTSSAAFTSGFQQLVKESKAASKQARSAIKRNPAIMHAARAFRPLLHFSTTKAGTCGKV